MVLIITLTTQLILTTTVENYLTSDNFSLKAEQQTPKANSMIIEASPPQESQLNVHNKIVTVGAKKEVLSKSVTRDRIQTKR